MNNKEINDFDRQIRESGITFSCDSGRILKILIIYYEGFKNTELENIQSKVVIPLRGDTHDDLLDIYVIGEGICRIEANGIGISGNCVAKYRDLLTVIHSVHR